MNHSITPPPELVEQWEEQFLESPTINGCFIQSYIAAKAARWGADQELEACCKAIDNVPGGWADSRHLRHVRRPKSLSLKEQAGGTKMTKLTALDLYILTDTIIHSLRFGSSWGSVATKEARDGMLKKLQKIMSEMEVELSVEKPND